MGEVFIPIHGCWPWKNSMKGHGEERWGATFRKQRHRTCFIHLFPKLGKEKKIKEMKREHTALFSINTARNLQEVLPFYAPGNYERRGKQRYTKWLCIKAALLGSTGLESMQLNNSEAFSSKQPQSCNAGVCAHIEDYWTRLKFQLFILLCPLLQILPSSPIVCAKWGSLLVGLYHLLHVVFFSFIFGIFPHFFETGSHNLDWHWTCYVTKDESELLILLPLFSKCWN